jgi:preprotein translocase subunit Sss1
MKMSDNIYDFIYNKLSDCFPVGGGAVGAVTQVKDFTFLPTWEAIVSTIVVAAIGAAVGYLIKLLFDIIFYKLKRKFNFFKFFRGK